MDKIAIVTGALRGIGLETSKQLLRKGYLVILTGRDEARGLPLRDQLRKEFPQAQFKTLDVSDTASIEKFAAEVLGEFKRVDVLINNAGIFIDRESPGPALSDHAKSVETTFKTNTLGPYLLTRAFLPSMIKNKFGRIVNVSSGLAQLTDMEAGNPAYRMSKTALNAATRVFASEARGTGVLVNVVSPGWVRTDMGGAGAPRSVEQGASGLVWAATLPDDGPTGGFFMDGEPIDW